MALFKVSLGPSSNLNTLALTEGFCWFTPDDGKFYIDAKKNNTLTRIPLNAAYADASGEVHSHNIVPMMNKTYTNIIGTSNDQAGASFYFGKIRPNDWYLVWRIRYRVRVYVPGLNGFDQKADVLITGSLASLRSYWSFNTIGAYYPACYHNLYRLKSTGYNAGYSHLLGVGMRSSYYPTSASYKRTFEIEILETENCTFEFYDTCKAQNSTAIPELAGANNYDGVSEINFVTNGLLETSDADTVEDRQTYFCAKTSTDKGIWAYSLFMEDGNGTYQGICTTSTGTIASDRTTATTKLANTAGFKVGGTIYFSNTNYNANSNIAGWGVIYNQTSVFDARYSFNVTLSNANPAVTLTAYKPVYLVGTIHDDGLYYLDSTWWTQTPTDTSKIYVLVGGCYDLSNDYCRIALYLHNPWYYYDGTRLLPYIDSLYVKQTSGVTDVAYDTTNKKITKTINGTTSDVVTISKIKTDLALSKSDIGLGNVTNTTALNNSTGAKGDIIYWSAANTPAHLTVESSTTKKFLTVTSLVPSWVAISKSDVGLSNVTNHAQVTAITWSDNKLKQSISGNTATDIVSIGEIKSALALAKSDVGLGNVPNVDTTNASNITSGTLAAARLATSGVTAGSYGPSANDSPAHGAGFSVPYFTVDDKGRVTAASTKTITLPPDTNNKVTQTNITATTSADYRILLSASTNDTTETNTSNKNTNLRFNTGTKTLSVGGNITATGDLTLTGDAYLNNNTYADGITAGSLLVNGNATFTNVPTSVTPAASSNDNSVATTAFVKTSVAGLSGAMHFRGITTVAMSDDATIDPQITGYDFTNNKQQGDVIIDSAMSYEYVWTGAKWERLGPDGSYKVVQSAVTAPTAVTNKWVSSIGQDANGVISANYSTLDTSGAWAGTASNVTGIVAVANGGTGANNAGTARTNLGLGSMATETASNYVKKAGDTMTGDMYHKSATGTTKFYFTRTGAAKESTGVWVDDTYTHFDVTNDETTANILFKLSATDTENNGDGSRALTSYITFAGANGQSTITADKFSGNLTGNVTGNADTATSAQAAASVPWAGITGKPSTSISWGAGTTAGPTLTVTAAGSSSDAVAIPAASTTASGIVTTSSLSFIGDKGFGRIIRYAYDSSNNATRYPGDTLLKNKAGTFVAEYWYDTGDATNISSGRFGWKLFSPLSTPDTTTTGYCERYFLPTVTSGLTEDKTYSILTTKNLVSIALGGTGASTAGTARTNLGLGSMATESASNYVKKSGDTMSGNLTTTGVVINDTNANIHLGFSRTGGHTAPNYINVPANGSLAFSNGGASGSNIVAMIDSVGIVPYLTNTKSVGTSDYKFASMYATNFYGAFKGNADTATSATTAANLANKPSLAASGNDITITAGGKTSDAFTVPYASNAGKTDKILTLANGRSFNGSADVTLLTNDLTPAMHKTYTSTNYYATSSGSWEAATWYFMSVKPDSWYKPWTVHFKVHSFCPGYASYESYSDCIISGRSTGFVYHNWNERQDTAHYYTTIYPLTSIGFNAGYGHAIGISILYASNYTTAAYYRTFEVDYYNCENCTVEILDTPVKWSSWTGTGSTNYGSLSSMNAVDRGLQEYGDANTYNVLEMSSNYITNGAVLRMPGYSLFGFNRNNLAQAISNYNSGYTGTTTSINTARVYNTEGLDWTKGLLYMTSSSNFATGANLTTSCRSALTAFDLRYSDNCIPLSTATTLGMVPYKAVYLRGVIKEDGLFYLAPIDVTYNSATYKRAWTQDIPTAVETDGTYQYVYWFVGYPYYNSSYASSLYLLNLFQENKMYWFHNGRFEEYAAPVASAEVATNDSAGNNISTTYVKKSGDTMTGNLVANSTSSLGTAANPWHNLVLGGATNATMDKTSVNPRITFLEGTGTLPVHLLYTDYDNYRNPAGLKIVGGDDAATPAWLEVEGNIYGARFYGPVTGNVTGNADTATSAVKITTTTTTLPSSGGNLWFLTYIGGSTAGNKDLKYSTRSYIYENASSTYLCAGALGKTGGITLFSSTNETNKYGNITPAALTAIRNWTLPDASGTIALMSHIAWNTIGTQLPNNADLNTYNASNSKLGLYYSLNSTQSANLGTSPWKLSGFRFISLAGYGSTRGHLIAWGTNETPYVRTENGTAGSYGPWCRLVYIENDNNNDSVAIGSSTLPVYINSSGKAVACTSYANASVNYATSANYINLYEARATTTTLNKAANYVGAGKMFHLVASSSTSAADNGKPPMGDANIFQMNWDNDGGYDAQIAISTSVNRMEFRDLPSTKKAWREVVTSTPGTAAGGTTLPVYISTTGVATAISYTIAKSVPSDAVFTDTKNTAGSTDTSSKIFLVGATSQASSAQTYSDNLVYATNGQLDANKVRVAETVSLVYNSTTLALDFIFS